MRSACPSDSARERERQREGGGEGETEPEEVDDLGAQRMAKEIKELERSLEEMNLQLGHSMEELERELEHSFESVTWDDDGVV